jgi:hypothetical protein
VRLAGDHVQQSRAIDAFEFHVRAVDPVHLRDWVTVGADVLHDGRLRCRLLPGPVPAQNPGAAQLEHVSVPAPAQQTSRLLHGMA